METKATLMFACLVLAGGAAAQSKIAEAGATLGGWPLREAEIRQVIEQSGSAPFDVAPALRIGNLSSFAWSRPLSPLS